MQRCKILVEIAMRWMYNFGKEERWDEESDYMEKISVLISGYDEAYNRALAVAISESEKNMLVTCMAPEKLDDITEELSEKFDIMLIGEELAKIKGVQPVKTLILCSSKMSEARDSSERRNIFKYQNIKTIAAEIYNEYAGIGFEKKNPGKNELRRGKNKGSVKIIGIAGGIDNSSIGYFSLMMARALSVSGKRTIYFNMSEFDEPAIVTSKVGIRTWDDFIYCSIYGKNGNVLTSPETFSSQDESGFLYFGRSKSRNTFSGLYPEEIYEFYAALKKNLNQDYAVAFMPDCGGKYFYENLKECDFALIVNDGSKTGIDSGSRIIKELRKVDSFKGRVITVCFGGKWDTGKKSDFSIPFSEDLFGVKFKQLTETETWRELSRTARFIGDGCIE